jgi:UDP-N-acetylmuramyl pentapeptide synthase
MRIGCGCPGETGPTDEAFFAYGSIDPRRDGRSPAAVDPDVTAVCYDSRQVTPGALFCGHRGFAVDGHRFIPDAVKKGAVAVVCRQPVTADAVVIRVADPRAALAGWPAGFTAIRRPR